MLRIFSQRRRPNLQYFWQYFKWESTLNRIIQLRNDGVFRSRDINPYAAVGQFGQYKMMQKNWKNTETLAYG